MKYINLKNLKGIINIKSFHCRLTLIAITFLMVISISFISISSILSHNIIISMITEENLNNVKAYSNIVSKVVKKRFQEIKTYADDPVIKSMDWNKIKPYLDNEKTVEEEKCCALGIVDMNGDLRINTTNKVLHLSDLKTLNKNADGNSFFSDPVISDFTGNTTINIATKIKNGDETIGYLINGLNIQKVFESIKISGYDEKSYFYIVDDKGKILLHPNNDFILNENITEVSKNISQELVKQAQIILNTNKGNVEFSEFGDSKVAYYHVIPNTGGWKIIVVRSYYNLYSPIVQLLIKLGLWSLIIIIIGTIVAKYIIKVISDPIVKLTDVFNKAATGDLSVIADETQGDEIGRAAKSFNIMMKKISNMTYYDPLTGLLNRNAFIDGMNLEIEHVKKEEGRFSIFYIAIDKFKNVNDVLGHVRGDVLLKEIAIKLKERYGKNHMISRISGDEFVIFSHEYGAFISSTNMAKDILEMFRQSWNVEGHEFYITASIGIATFPEDGKTEEEIIKNAGIAKSKVKETGGDNFKFYNKDMNDKLKEQVTLDALLHNALENNEFELYYQPLVSIKTKKIEAVEALIRWNSKELGMMPPAKFIPRLEDNGLIVPVGRWILKEACRQSKYWQDSGLKPICISINVSAYQFEQRDFVEVVSKIIKETELDPKYIELEITEGVAMDNVEDKIKKLLSLKNLGVKIAIDDFGTGYSSLNYLRKFPIDSLKIDQSFVRDINNSSAKSIISTIVSIGKNLNLEIIAEGVETEEQLDFIKKEQCDKIQGYIFSKPTNEKVFIEMLGEDKEFIS